jgi:protein-L-isoaspartate(D-aspartate) O-methyltransferase
MQAPDDESPDYEAARAALVASLRRDISDERVLEAMARLPRERFVDEEWRQFAYEDRPIPIGHGQTTSQPRMIALMLQELRLQPEDEVLEIGTGSGYQTALLADLAGEVVGVELIPSLAVKASQVLAQLGYEAVAVNVARDELGWPQSAPYDAIVVAAAAPRVPQSLADQLAPGGRLVIPVGTRDGQDLLVVEKTAEGLVVTRRGACRFVPLVGRDAFSASDAYSN